MTDLSTHDEFFTTAQAADYLNVSVRTLARRHAMRVGPPRVQHGSKIGYFRMSLIAWLKSNERNPPQR